MEWFTTSTAESPQPIEGGQGTKEWTESIRTSELEETEAEPDMAHVKELVMALMVWPSHRVRGS